MTEIPPEVLQLGARLTESMARNGTALVRDKIRTARAAGRDQETIAALTEIINDLQDDKTDLVQIAQGYRSQLVSQQLASGDIRYIADTLFPLIEQLVGTSAESDDEDEDDDARAVAEAKRQSSLQMLETMRALLSVETAQILQLLGFNFRRAIGEPLTALCESLILAKVSGANDLQQQIQLAHLQNQTAMATMVSDPLAYDRFRAMYG
ncbi:hypothetical protein GM708_06645 [Vibrio cholerae]|nr:hypothetical protein [Vibrio cholerae]